MLPLLLALWTLSPPAALARAAQEPSPGRVPAREDSAAQDSAAQDFAGQDFAGQDFAGQDSAAQDSKARDAWAPVAAILTEHCLSCHGASKARGGLRLHTAEDLAAGGDEGPVIIPGQPDHSLLFQAVAGLHDELSMPPSGALGDSQLAALREWISGGAPWPRGEGLNQAGTEAAHWAFQPIADPAPPAVRGAPGQSPLDRFVRAPLEARGWTPSPEAEPAILLRRLHLDLTGLPPTPERIQAFLTDPSDSAYEAEVNRLLDSAQYAERWAAHWLDLARYADSDGYEKDNVRPHAWRWRDWVIDSLHADQPYDEFLRDQLAGDLLEPRRLEAHVATGLHRNTLTNREGGVDPEQFRVEQVVDRVNTLGASVLGLTLGCARCHTHKYDPITQREFFGLVAFFDSADEVDIPAATPAEQTAYQEALDQYEQQWSSAEQHLRSIEAELEPGLDAWITEHQGLEVAWHTFEWTRLHSEAGAELEPLDDASILVQGANAVHDHYTLEARGPRRITALRLETLHDERLPKRGPGRAENGNFVLTELQLFALDDAPADGPADQRGSPRRLSAARADYSQDRWAVAGAVDGDPRSGWAVMDSGRGGPRAATASFQCSPAESAGGRWLLRLENDYGNHHHLGRFRLSFSELPAEVLSLGDAALAALALPAPQRDIAQQQALREAFLRSAATWRKARAALDATLARAPSPPSTRAPVLAERPQPRHTHVHVRGDFLRPAEEVQPHVPAVLPPLQAEGGRADRRDLARWLLAPEHPLTDRVFVNQVWQHLFGQGLVPTPDDFGSRGTPPSHPALLDWLVQRTREDGHSRKALIRRIVLSSTYRQSSRLRPELLEQDPLNRLLARQNRWRVEAEVVRDRALLAAGRLSTRVGGPSIRPPLPPGVIDVGYASSLKWPVSTGADRDRRGLYIHRQRTVPYPMMLAFDAPETLVSCTRRHRSNTPLQALTLRNDPVFVDLALHLAKAAWASGDDDLSRLQNMVLRALGRPLRDDEQPVLQRLLSQARAEFQARPEAARLLLQEGASSSKKHDRDTKARPASTVDPAPLDPDLLDPDPLHPDLAAWLVLARTLFGLDEFLSRE